MTGSIVIAGSLAQKPRYGGHTWVFLQYLLGFRRLGWDVLFLDRLEPEMCVDQAGQPCSLEDSLNLAYLREVMERFQLGDAFALQYDSGRRSIGLSRPQLAARCKRANLLLNVMGFITDPEILGSVRQRVFLDIDPGFPQMWKALGLHDSFAGHDRYVTIGENIGALIARCRPASWSGSRRRNRSCSTNGKRTRPLARERLRVLAHGADRMAPSPTAEEPMASARTSSVNSLPCPVRPAIVSRWRSISIPPR